jgi:hypothetical protein
MVFVPEVPVSVSTKNAVGAEVSPPGTDLFVIVIETESVAPFPLPDEAAVA